MIAEKLIKLAYEAILNNDFEQAIAWFKKAIIIEPNNASFHYKLSITYARSNQMTRAMEHAEKAYELESDNEQFRLHIQNLRAKELVRKARTYFYAEDDQLYMAIVLLKQSIELDPLSLDAYLMLALAYSEVKEYDAAIRVLREGIQLEPQHETAQSLLQQLEGKLKQYLQR